MEKVLHVSAAWFACDYQQANGEAICTRCGAVGRKRNLCVNCEAEGYTLVIATDGGTTMTKVTNLATGTTQEFSSSPEEAVIAAHAQSRGDFNTWDYATRYTAELIVGHFSVACGDFCAMNADFAAKTKEQITAELSELRAR